MLDLFKHAGWVAYPLGFFSILALGVLLERLFTLSRLRAFENAAFRAMEERLSADDDSVLDDAALTGAPVTQVMRTMRMVRGAGSDSLFNVADVALSMQRLRLRRYLNILATVGATAPFIGLFGTVLGVMQAFRGLSKLSGDVLSQGISEALSATAVGLLVAIPSVICYNLLLAKTQTMLLHIHAHIAQLTPLLNQPVGHRNRQEVV